MRWLRAGVVGALLALLVVAAPSRGQEPDQGYPSDWPSSEQCPSSIGSYSLTVVYRGDDPPTHGIICWYGETPGRFDRNVSVEWGVDATPGNDYLCEDEPEASESYLIRDSGTVRARVQSQFGTSTSDLMDHFLRIAEPLAVPCDSTTEITTTTTTSTTVEDETTTTAPAGPCAIDGVVTAPDRSALAGVVVELDGPGEIEIARTSTDASGRYHFDAVKGTDRFSAERDDVEIVMRLLDPGGVWELWHADARAAVRSKPFKVAQPTCRADIDLGALGTLAIADPSQAERWPAMVAMTRRLVRAARFVADPKGLGFTMDNHLPVEVYAWCDGTAPVACPSAAAGKTAEGAPFFRGGADPHIVLGPDESASEAVVGCESDTIGHEWGHAVTADLFGSEVPHGQGRTNHAGYYGNASSNDSWTEALASFLGMEARKHQGGPPSPTFRSCAPGAFELDYERNFRPWYGIGSYEEWAIAGLLLDVEDGPADYRAERVPSMVDRDVKLLVVPDPAGRVIVGRVAHRAGPADHVRVDMLDGNKNLGGGEAVVDDDRWFYFPVPKAIQAFRSVRAYGVRGGGNGADDDPLDATPTQLWDAIATYHSAIAHAGRPAGITGVFDVVDLHAALATTFAGDRDANGIDDVDQLFRDHGLFADPEGDLTFQAGALIGRTDRPLKGGASVDRYDVVMPPSTRVDVDGPDDATYIVSTTYPAPDNGAGTAYVAVPDADGRIVVAVPGEESDATVTILAVAPGKLPSIVDVIDPAAFWKEAAAHDGEPFLSLHVALEEGELSDGGGGSGGPPIGIGGALLGVGLGVAIIGRRKTPLLVLAVALGAGGAGVVAWAQSADSGDGRPGTELALAADPELPVATSTTSTSTSAATAATTSTTASTTTTTTPVGDPDAVLTPARWSSSEALPDSGDASYGAERAGDRANETAWCTAEDGSGATITASFDAPTAITVVGLIAGYDKVDAASGRDRWDENRHPVSITWSFDDGTTFNVVLTGERTMQYQAFGEPIVTNNVTLTIESTSGIGDTCVSEIELRGHPA